jgi:hypothetical protein
MSKERVHYFTRRNMELDITFDPPRDPVDRIGASGDGGSHYSRIKQFRYPRSPDPSGRNNRRELFGYHEDAKEGKHLEEAYQEALADEQYRVSQRHLEKQKRLKRKDNLDKAAHMTLLGPSRDVERTEERSVRHLVSVSCWNLTYLSAI